MQRGDLSGKVIYDKKPVISGSVVVVGSDNIPVTGPIQSDGTYTVKGVPTGQVRLAVSSPLPVPPPDTAKKPEGSGSLPLKPRPDKDAPPPPPPPGWFPIPPEFSDPEKSGLTTTVKSGSNPHDITFP